MGFIEEGRQLIQDFVTPEIRSLDARLTAVEKRLGLLDSGESKIEFSFEERVDGNRKRMMEQLHGMEDRMRAQIVERLARVESKLQNVA
jgi:hypothetical protein